MRQTMQSVRHDISLMFVICQPRPKGLHHRNGLGRRVVQLKQAERGGMLQGTIFFEPLQGVRIQSTSG